MTPPSRRALRGRVTPHSEVAAPSEDARTGDYGGSHRERPERATVDANRDRAQTGLVGKPANNVTLSGGALSPWLRRRPALAGFLLEDREGAALAADSAAAHG